MSEQAKQLTVIEQRQDELPVARDLHLFARDPAELAEAQGHLIRWCEAKLAELSVDLQDMRENLAVAKRNKWRPTAWQHRIRMVGRRYQFYVKVKKALQAGYYIVPPFPVETFAIRVKEGVDPIEGYVETDWRPTAASHEQTADNLPAGEGQYVSPLPRISTDYFDKMLKDGTTKRQRYTQAIGWRDVDFPIGLVKPQILDETGKAMALKIFDKIGVLPAQRRNSYR